MKKPKLQPHQFYPSEFYWKDQYADTKRVEEVCEILNQLTPEQVDAVQYYARSRGAQEAFDACEDGSN
jgi:hypothetical protein